MGFGRRGGRGRINIAENDDNAKARRLKPTLLVGVLELSFQSGTDS